MEVFGIIGMSMGTMGFIFGIASMSRINKLELKLKELNVIDKDYKST